jgi:hypothetical protein
MSKAVLRRSVCIVAIAVVMCSASLFGQQMSSIGGVDNSTMGIYRALAQVSLATYERGDVASAAKAARAIELVWDTSEGDLKKASPALYEEIDSAMDSFIKPLINANKKAPDSKALKVAYEGYLEKLKKADEPWK